MRLMSVRRICFIFIIFSFNHSVDSYGRESELTDNDLRERGINIKKEEFWKDDGVSQEKRSSLNLLNELGVDRKNIVAYSVMVSFLAVEWLFQGNSSESDLEIEGDNINEHAKEERIKKGFYNVIADTSAKWISRSLNSAPIAQKIEELMPSFKSDYAKGILNALYRQCGRESISNQTVFGTFTACITDYILVVKYKIMRRSGASGGFLRSTKFAKYKGVEKKSSLGSAIEDVKKAEINNDQNSLEIARQEESKSLMKMASEKRPIRKELFAELGTAISEMKKED